MTTISKDFNIRNGASIGTGSPNYLAISGSTLPVPSGSLPTVTIAASGSDQNISIELKPKGTGKIVIPANAISFSLELTDRSTETIPFYPTLTSSTTDGINALSISSTKLSFIPSTGTLSVTVLNSSSDKELKHNISTITDPLAALSQLRGVAFNWKDTGLKSYGVIAQELEEVLPDLVGIDANNYKTVNYIPIIGFLIEAVKTQQLQISALSEKIDKLSNGL